MPYPFCLRSGYGILIYLNKIFMNPHSALLVIDTQKGSFTLETPRFDTEGVVKRINDLATTFRKNNAPVVFIQHDGTGSGEFEKNTEEWEITTKN
ncbi:MAG: nicotinamidase-related amidase [Patescibacteria group bacterium]|jgi:nicotinamidase-related amidase